MLGDPTTTAQLLDPAFVNLLSNERHNLNGALVNLELWDGGDTTGIFRYAFRDYRYGSGPNAGMRWVGLPEHRLDLDLFRVLTPWLVVEVDPSFQTNVPLNAANTQVLGSYFQLDALLHFTPFPDSRISAGYQNLFSDSRSLRRPGWILNVLLTF